MSIWLEIGRAATCSLSERDPEVIATICATVEQLAPQIKRIGFYPTDGSRPFSMAYEPDTGWRQAAQKGRARAPSAPRR